MKVSSKTAFGVGRWVCQHGVIFHGLTMSVDVWFQSSFWWSAVVAAFLVQRDIRRDDVDFERNDLSGTS